MTEQQVKLYWEAINRIRQGLSPTEMSYRAPTQNLLESVANARIRVLHEPGMAAGGRACRPDFGIYNAAGVIGYLECKKPGEKLDAILRGRQMQEYRNLSANVVLTDHWRWTLTRDGKKIDEVDLHGADEFSALLALLEKFFSGEPEAIGDAKRLAGALAARCGMLRDALLRSLPNDQGKLNGLYEVFQNHLYKGMEEKAFSDALAQTVIFSLLMAKLGDGDEKVDLWNVDRRIPQSFALIRELAGFLRSLDPDENPNYANLKWIIDDILLIVNSIDVAAVAETMRLTQTAGADDAQDPYNYFYETFLASYDNKTRKARGVYYTPMPVVRFIVRAINDVLKHDFELHEGLAAREVTSLDFAAGSGTFMLEWLRRSLADVPANERRLLAHERLLPRSYGFELLIAPYVISHLKIAGYLDEMGCGIDLKSAGKALNICLANTLEDYKIPGELPFVPALKDEIEKAGTIKKAPILVIYGNPPYAVNSANNGDWIVKQVEQYRFVGDAALGERNSRGLQDDYVKFIRFAQFKMAGVPRGMVAVVTNHAFLDNITFPGMRRSLMQTFNRLYFLDLHGNSRKLLASSDAGAAHDENVFDIQQGVCISLMIKNPALSAGVYYADIKGVREEKYEFCEGGSVSSIKWKKLAPRAPHFLFVPQSKKASASYQKFASLRDIFAAHNSGITTGRDNLTIAHTAAEMRRQASEFASLPEAAARKRFALGADTEEWQWALAREDVRELKDENFCRIAYRPFDVRHTYFTGKSRGFHTRPRGEFMHHMRAGGNVALITVRQVAEKEFNHVFAAQTIIENRMTLSNKGAAYLFPLYLFGGNGNNGDLPIDRKRENFAPDFRAKLDDLYGQAHSADAVLHYIYAALHSPDYRRRYAGFLAYDFPRIEFVADNAEFERRAAIGKRLMDAHLLKNKAGDFALHGGNFMIERASVDGARLQINRECWLELPRADILQLRVGGYLPLQKYLHYRRGRELSADDIETLRKAAAALELTIELCAQIDG